MPMMLAATLTGTFMLFAPKQIFSLSSRINIAVAGTIVLAGALVVLWPQIEPRLIGHTAPGSSGRDIIWDYYLEAIGKNPWFGRGVGSGVSLLPTIDDYRIEYTNAAHNEYLRITMDGGIVGLVLVFGAIAYWVWLESRFMARPVRILFLCFMADFALASFTDNTLSSPFTLLMFFTLALITQRARQEAAEVFWQSRGTPPPRQPLVTPPRPAAGE
jgi:O-antigen ligase